jgi:hypothetical protein
MKNIFGRPHLPSAGRVILIVQCTRSQVRPVVLRGHRFGSCRRRIGLPAIHCFMPDGSLRRAPCEPGY